MVPMPVARGVVWSALVANEMLANAGGKRRGMVNLGWSESGVPATVSGCCDVGWAVSVAHARRGAP